MKTRKTLEVNTLITLVKKLTSHELLQIKGGDGGIPTPINNTDFD